MDSYTPNQRGYRTKNLNKRLEKCVDDEERSQVQDALDYLASKKKAKPTSSGPRKPKQYKSAATISDSDEESAEPTHSFSGITGLARKVRGARRAAERSSSEGGDRPDFDEENARPDDEENARPDDEDRPDPSDEYGPPSDDHPPPPTPPTDAMDIFENVEGLGGALTPRLSEVEEQQMDIDDPDLPGGSGSHVQRSPGTAHPDEPAKKRARTEGE